MADAKTRTAITYSEQFSQSAANTELPPGFVEFHKRNFCKYFQLAPLEFDGRSVLETGAGPGKHAAVLHLLGAQVTAVDLLESNVRAIERLTAHHNFAHLVAYRADLMQPLPEEWSRFGLISAHNWLQHAEDPARVLDNLIAKLEVGGRLYVSVYQSGTFRFFISRIARSVLRWEDREVVKRLVPFFFPLGFLEFDNPDDIYYENVFDDFYVPYLWTFRYEPLVRFLNSRGCEVLVPHAGRSRLCEIDNEPLEVGLVKVSEKAKAGTAERLEHDIDEFYTEYVEDEAGRELIAESVGLALEGIDLMQASPDGDSHYRAAFALGLYRLRGAFSHSEGVEQRHTALQAYLKRLVTGDTSSIRAWKSSDSFYTRHRSGYV